MPLFAQIKRLQDAAQSRFNSIVATIKADTSQKQTSSHLAYSTSTALQDWLEAAVTALQEGLVERDTEVIFTTLHQSKATLSLLLTTCIDALYEQVGYAWEFMQVRLLLLAALAGEHILFIGPPGTAKSELGRRLARLYKGTFFERLLTRFSVPEVRNHSPPCQ